MTRWGDPVLHAPCAPVEQFDDDLHRLIADLVATMRAADGVGLAANQIGVALRVFVFDCIDDDGVAHQGVICNPRVSTPEGRDRVLEDAEEGCLSLPGAFITCSRPDTATVTGVDADGEPVTYTGTGLLARCLQHETDHLAGVVFGDRLSARIRKRLLKEAERFVDDYPPSWPAASD